MIFRILLVISRYLRRKTSLVLNKSRKCELSIQIIYISDAYYYVFGVTLQHLTAKTLHRNIRSNLWFCFISVTRALM